MFLNYYACLYNITEAFKRTRINGALKFCSTKAFLQVYLQKLEVCSGKIKTYLENRKHLQVWKLTVLWYIRVRMHLYQNQPV